MKRNNLLESLPAIQEELKCRADHLHNLYPGEQIQKELDRVNGLIHIVDENIIHINTDKYTVIYTDPWIIDSPIQQPKMRRILVKKEETLEEAIEKELTLVNVVFIFEVWPKCEGEQDQ